MLPANQPIMKTLRPYAHKAFYGRKTMEGYTFPQFLLALIRQGKIGGNHYRVELPIPWWKWWNNFRVGPQHNVGNGGNNFSVGTHNLMVEMMELTSVLASNTL